MTRIFASILVLGIAAGPAFAGAFPEKAESRVPATGKSYVDDVQVNMPLKRMDQIRHSGSITFGGTELLSATGSSSTKPIFSPNR